MFCKDCGTQLTEGSKFCSNCGSSLSTTPNNCPVGFSGSDTPVLALKPVFVPWVTIVSVLPLQIFFAIWGGGFFGGFGMFGAKAIGLSLPTWSTFAFFGLLFFVGIPLLAYTAKKRTYAETQYKFYPDRLEYAEGFWTAENKTIHYKNITEANLQRGVIQRKYGLGTVYLATPATGIQHGHAVSGIKIADIANSEDVYDTIRNLLNSNQ